MPKLSIFVSYSHKDEIWKDRLLRHLGVLRQQYSIEVWDDRRISAGDDWQQEIQGAIAAAGMAILMISPDFLTSNFIMNEEVPRLLQRYATQGLRIVPIIVEPCGWLNIRWLARYAARPKDGRPLSAGNTGQIETDLMAIATEIDNLLKHAGFCPEPQTFAPLPPDKISLADLPSTSPDLFGREKELSMLEQAWYDPGINIVSLIAWGGVGKTALVNAWLNQIGQKSYHGAGRVYGYSFYSQGSAERKQPSADPFMARALTWFGDADPDKGSPWDKGARLAELVTQQRSLLILDGLEPLQYPPGGELGGHLRDRGLQCFLRELARYNPGLCVVSSRLPVDDLKDFIGTVVAQIELAHLPPEAGAQCLGKLGVKGTDDDLRRASAEFDGHALALTLLGCYLAVVYQGDVGQRDKIARVIGERKHGGHAHRMMESYERWFEGKTELNILYIMGLFDRPAEGRAVAAIRAEPVVPDLNLALQDLSDQDWQYAMHNLREARLITTEGIHAIDCHPLVREHFGDRFRKRFPDAWKEAHRRLYEYYKGQTGDLPDTIEGLVPLYAAVNHGCDAGHHTEALNDVYKRRILRGETYFSWKTFGTFGAELGALSGFFEKLWERPIAGLCESDRAFVLKEAAFDLQALLRIKEAACPLQAALEGYIRQSDWRNAAIASRNLTKLYLTIGDLGLGIRNGEQGIDLAKRSGDAYQLSGNLTVMADVLHHAGKLLEASQRFREAEEIQTLREPQFPYLYSYRGYRFCELLLASGSHLEVAERAGRTLSLLGRKELSLFTIALAHLSKGRALVVKVQKDRRNDLTEAIAELDLGVDGLRQAGQQDHLPRGLLARSEAYRLSCKFEGAMRDLDEAVSIATRGDMRLHEADCQLERARLYLAMGQRSEAWKSLRIAEKIIMETGYHRRDVETYLIRAQLHLAAEEKDIGYEVLQKAKQLIEEMGMHRWDTEANGIAEQVQSLA